MSTNKSQLIRLTETLHHSFLMLVAAAYVLAALGPALGLWAKQSVVSVPSTIGLTRWNVN